jgi:cyclase
MIRKTRIVPVIMLKNGNVVQSKKFKRHQILGDPSSVVRRLSNWFSDELIYLDISRPDQEQVELRADLKHKPKYTTLEIMEEVSQKCFMPLTCGGGVKKIDDIYDRLRVGADKVSINTQAFHDLSFINKSSKEFGSQCIIASIDAKRVESPSKWEVFVGCGKIATGKDPISWAKELEAQGAGEIIINSIDQDGSAQGYDIELVHTLTNAVRIPVIALGGVGEWQHFADCIDQAKPSAVAAGNIFHFKENSIYHANNFLYKSGYNVRKPIVKSLFSEGGF